MYGFRFFLIVVIVILCFSQEGYAKNVEFELQPDEIIMTFLKLSSGEAAFIRSSKDKIILINTGDEGTEKELKEQLKFYNITHVDVLILTSTAPEMTGNVPFLLKHFSPMEIFAPSSMNHERKMKSVTSLSTGDIKHLLEGMSVEVIDQNETELFLLFTYGKHRIFYSGDLSKEQVHTLKSKMIKATIVKVGDFGEDMEMDEQTIEQLNPEVAVIFKKRHHVASDQVLEVLEETWTEVYETKKVGNVTVKCNYHDYEIYTLLRNNANYLTQ